MHLWPSMRLRESFKKAYIDKLDRNLHRMRREKQTHQQKLLENNNGGDEDHDSNNRSGCLREFLVIVSCCYCCFCCGACVEEEN